MRIGHRKIRSYLRFTCVANVALLAGASSSASQQNSPLVVYSMEGLLRGPAQLLVESWGTIVGSELRVTIRAHNRGTVPDSFGFNISCEDEVKLYRDTTYSGPSLAFRLGSKPGTQSGRVDVTLAPGQWHQEACGPLPLSQLVQEDGRPAPPGVYYVVFDLSRSMARPLPTANWGGMVAIGAYTADTVTMATSPLKLIGTSAVVDSMLHIVVTTLNASRWPVSFGSTCHEFPRGDVLLYQDAAHSSVPFRYVPKPDPFRVRSGLRTSWSHVPNEAFTEACDPYPITQLKRGADPIPPGTYYVVYKTNPDRGPQAFDTLNLGKVTIP